MKYLADDQDKRYLPVDVRINGFSSFPGSPFALYISNNKLYFLNLLTGETGHLSEFSEVLTVKCSSKNTFVFSSFDDVYVADFAEGKATVQQKYRIKSTASSAIAATASLDRIVLLAFENLVVISNGKPMSKNLGPIQYAMALSADGNLIASGSESGITILDASTLAIKKKFETSALPICLSFSPDGKTLLYGDDRAKLYSLQMNSGEKTEYENPFYSKPVYFAWQDTGCHFVVSFLSQCVNWYEVGVETAAFAYLEEFDSRYFQHASLLDTDVIAICVENLRTSAVVESIPTSDVVVLQRLKS